MGKQMGQSRIFRIAAPVTGAEHILVSMPSFKASCASTAPFVFPGAAANDVVPNGRGHETKMRGEI
ncbi:hypothetical protein CV023_06205 [Brevibacterium sp. CCUG 69071]|nr:hypothetical protein [Brevibacterium sp. CCUG 69071]